MLTRIHLTLVALATAALFASPAGAFTFFDTGETGGNPEGNLLGVTITNPGDIGADIPLSWTVDSSVLGDGDILTATANVHVDSFSDSEIVLSITITNTTVLSSTLTNADILSFGFGVEPDATASFDTAGGVFDGVGDGSGPQQTYPGGFKGIDVCVYGQNCSGGAVAQGLHAGDSDSFVLSLAGDFSDGEADLLYFGVKFQTNKGSFEPGAGGSPVPEPSGALAFAVALVVLRRHLRRD